LVEYQGLDLPSYIKKIKNWTKQPTSGSKEKQLQQALSASISTGRGPRWALGIFLN
jgi:hypothetical protein